MFCQLLVLHIKLRQMTTRYYLPRWHAAIKTKQELAASFLAGKFKLVNGRFLVKPGPSFHFQKAAVSCSQKSVSGIGPHQTARFDSIYLIATIGLDLTLHWNLHQGNLLSGVLLQHIGSPYKCCKESYVHPTEKLVGKLAFRQ